MKNITSLIILCFLFFTVSAQIPPIEWQKSYGGSEDDRSASIIQAHDNGYITVGRSKSVDGDVLGNHGDYDYWVTKLDSVGNLTWQKSYGGSKDESAQGIIKTLDGGYLITGQSLSNDGDVTGHHGDSTHYDSWIVKINSFGNLLWQKSFGGSGDEQSDYLIQNSDGNYVIIGYSNSIDGDVSVNNGQHDIWIIVINSMGNLLSEKSFGGTNEDYPQAIHQTTDGGYVFTGSSASNDGDLTFNNGSWDAWIVKIDSSRNVVWQKSYGGSDNDGIYAIEQTHDNGFIAVGNSGSNDGDVTGNHGDWDVWAIRLDTLGNLLWQKSLGGSGFDASNDVKETKKHEFIIAGVSESSDGDVSINKGGKDIWIVLLDSIGNLIDNKSFGGTLDESAECIISLENPNNLKGGFLVTGPSFSNNLDLTSHYGDTLHYDYWVFKLSNPISTTYTSSISNKYVDLTISPNPTFGSSTIQFTNTLGNSTFVLSNILGETVLTYYNMISNQIQIDLGQLPDGVFPFKIFNSDFIISGKLIKE